IAFISDRDGGDDDIFTMTITGASQTNRTASSSDNESMINWSPDSSKIAFQYDFDNQFDIYTIDSDGTNRTNLTNNASDDYSPYWIDSSNIVFVSTRDSNREIYKVNISNLTETNISNNTSEDSLISAFAGMQ
ncbi:MAG: TolB family protein, partial [Candidatus Sericytochromatia bacterium]